METAATENGATGRSTADRVLTRCVAVLDRVERGVSLQDADRDEESSPLALNCLFTILRHQAPIDAGIDRLAQGRVRPRIRRVLRWGFAEILYLRGLAPAVATDTCVRYARRHFSAAEAGFVNAVLRRLAATAPADFLATVMATAPDWVKLELGEPLYGRWVRRFAPEDLRRLADVLLAPALLTVRLCRGATVGDLPALRPLALPAWAGTETMWTCEDPGRLFSSPAHRRGALYVQDPSTLLATRLLAPGVGERVADLCAAPGGKALMLAEAVGPGGTVVGMDRSLRRLARLKQNLSAWSRCMLLVGDAVRPAFPPGLFDAVLLDVPCSNTGVVRRRPDVRWHFSEERLAALVELQGRILAGGAALVRPGGRLVYSTCSLEPEENGEQVRRFLADRPDFRLTAEKEILPDYGHDGAYAALLLRPGASAPLA